MQQGWVHTQEGQGHIRIWRIERKTLCIGMRGGRGGGGGDMALACANLEFRNVQDKEGGNT